MRSGRDEQLLWICLIEATALPGDEHFGRGAFTNGLVLASSPEEAEGAFSAALLVLGWRLERVQDAEEFETRCLSHEVDPELVELSAVARETGQPHFGTFFTWLERPPE